MSKWGKGRPEINEEMEIHEGLFEKNMEKDQPEEISLEELGLPEEWWTESIKEIQNKEIQKQEIERAKKIADKERVLNEKLESGEISQDRYADEKLGPLSREKASFSTQCDLESEGIIRDLMWDVFEDWDWMLSDASGDTGLTETKEGIKELISIGGPEYAQEEADRIAKEGRLTKKAHDVISRQVRIHKE